MPSTSPERRERALARSLLLLALVLLALAALPAAEARAAKDKAGQLCEVTSAVSGEGQLRERTRKCRKDDVLVVPLVAASITAARVAALVCDLSDQVLIEATTEAPGVARVTCTYAGEVRGKR